MKEQHYRVAGHTFSLRMAENEILWQSLKNAYVSFLLPTLISKPLFTLTIQDLSFGIEVISTEKPHLEQIGVDGNLFRYYQFADHYRFEDFSPAGELNGVLCVDIGLHTALLYVCSHPLRRKLMADYGIMLMYILNTVCLDTFVMHASVVLSEGYGYLLMGRSGTGKSTHSSLWMKYIPGSKRLNDDHPVVRLIDNMPIVYGSPWSGKTPCYCNLSAPIGGFVRLSQSCRNSIRCLSPVEAYASLSASCAAMTWRAEHAEAKHFMIQHLIGRVPCWQLECLPDAAAVRLCAKTVRKDFAVCPD